MSLSLHLTAGLSGSAEFGGVAPTRIPGPGDAYGSLGGKACNSEAHTYDRPPYSSPTLPVYRLFHDIIGQINADYRAIVLRNRDSGQATLNNVKLWGDSGAPPVPLESYQGIQIGTETPSGGTIQRIADHMTAPAGVTFSAPSQASPIALGNLAYDADAFVWLKRMIVTDAPPFGGTGYWVRSLFASWDGLATPVRFPIMHIGNGVDASGNALLASLTVTGSRDGKLVYLGEGAEYTLLVKNNSGALVDAITNQAYVSVFRVATDDPLVITPSPLMLSVGQLLRTATGTYTYKFIPKSLGLYMLYFDISGVLFHRVMINVIE